MNRFIRTLVPILVLALFWTGAWFYGANEIRNQFASLQAQIEAEGGALSCADLRIDGLPFRYDVECISLDLTIEDVRYSLPVLAGALRIYAPTHIVVSAQGPLHIEDQLWGTRRDVAWDNLQMSARTNGFALARISAMVTNARVTDAFFADRLIASAGELEAHLFDIPDFYDPEAKRATWGAFVRGIEFNMPEIDIADGDLRFEAEISGLPDDLRALTLQSVAEQWQNRSDAIKVHVLEGRDARSSVHLTGQLSLDSENLWEGDFDLTTRDMMERLSFMGPPIFLAVYLGDPNGNGELYRAYSLRHGVLFAGNAPLQALPPLF